MTVHECLQKADIDRRSAERLLAFALQKTRTELFLSDNDEVPPHLLKTYFSYKERLKNNEPIEYIICSKEFYGREFCVGKGVLIPRNATEKLVEQTIAMLNAPSQSPSCSIEEVDTDIIIASGWLRKGEVVDILDIGTGSGCIILTLALEMPSSFTYIGVEKERDALVYAEKNRALSHLEEKVSFIHGDGIEIVQKHQRPFFVVSNPPYVPSEYPLEPSVHNFEPHSALFAGKDGTDVITLLLKAMQENPLCLGFALECREDQGKNVREILVKGNEG